jgi:hypothetical protein
MCRTCTHVNCGVYHACAYLARDFLPQKEVLWRKACGGYVPCWLVRNSLVSASVFASGQLCPALRSYVAYIQRQFELSLHGGLPFWPQMCLEFISASPRRIDSSLWGLLRQTRTAAARIVGCAAMARGMRGDSEPFLSTNTLSRSGGTGVPRIH